MPALSIGEFIAISGALIASAVSVFTLISRKNLEDASAAKAITDATTQLIDPLREEIERLVIRVDALEFENHEQAATIKEQTTIIRRHEATMRKQSSTIERQAVTISRLNFELQAERDRLRELGDVIKELREDNKILNDMLLAVQEENNDEC